jgi:hypothetical protein
MAMRFRDGLEALHSMLDRSERSPDMTQCLAHPDYRTMRTETERQAFHQVMTAAQASGAIVLSVDPRKAPEDIQFARLLDREVLARFLGRVPAAGEAEAAVGRLCADVRDLPGWVAALIPDMAAGWRVRREPFPGLAVNDVAAARKFLAILAAIDRNEHLRGWDMRTFSRRACGDSKAVEQSMNRLARVLRVRFDIPAADAREVLAAMGIEKFPQPVLIRGPLATGDGVAVRAEPYLGIPPDWAGAFGLSRAVPYVLVVENLASFNRHCREIGDGGVVLFSGGFPSRAVMAAIRRLDDLLSETVPFYHWGDGDRHGRLIFQHIANGLRRTLLPHLADVAVTEQEETDPRSPLDPQR